MSEAQNQERPFSALRRTPLSVQQRFLVSFPPDSQLQLSDDDLN
jgi:hypothetical protein